MFMDRISEGSDRVKHPVSVYVRVVPVINMIKLCLYISPEWFDLRNHSINTCILVLCNILFRFVLGIVNK